MKKIFYIVFAILLIFTYSINCFATVDSEIIITNNDIKTTIIFEDNSSYTYEQKLYIADMLLYGESDINFVQQRSWCWLTGHDKTTEYVGIITHKKYATEPRCLEEIYEVTTCSKCDLYDMVLVSSGRIACCAEQ